ncbi:hypothetical protein QBC43DRAFT_341396 [Cladorrhinum sp. PSN259]|nr:hypothetical protein QBC43DRAFT_341396 [Cladorrhinum sp. PSN259]
MSEPPPTPSSRSQQRDESPPTADSFVNKKKRGAIAAQACDTCRNRKQRCDELRPKCTTCRNLGQDCVYREAPPTKKDKTLVEILERVKNVEEGMVRLESKFDERPPNLPTTVFPSISAQTSHFVQCEAPSLGPSHPPPSLPELNPSSFASGSGDDHYKYVSSVHQMLGWPVVKQLLASIQPQVPHIDLTTLDEDGVATMLAIHRVAHEFVPIEPFGPTSAQTILNMPGASILDHLRRLSEAYFDTFNSIYPILDRRYFMTQTLPTVFNDRFSATTSSTVAILVFALGEASMAGFDGPPLHIYDGRLSGVKGGSANKPPGIEWFNEARRRLGFNYTEISLENIQMFALAGAYYGCCFCPAGFWKSARAASQACQDLIDSDSRALSSSNANLLRRIFWYCSIMETCLNLELGFPLLGLQKYEDLVCKDPALGDHEEPIILEQFASQIALRRILVNFHETLSQNTMPVSFGSTWSSPLPMPSRIRQCFVQLEKWRGMLPVHFRWQEDSPGAFPNLHIASMASSPIALHTPINSPLSPSILQQPQSAGAVPLVDQNQQPLMFTTDLDSPPARYPLAIDIQYALLRSRYYYTKFLIHRPFIYKAMHHPDSMTTDDALGVAECLKTSLKWPIAMSPTCKHKRLIPCMFLFTQSFFGILVLLHLSDKIPVLREIRTTMCGERFETDARETVGLYLDWLRDLKEIDVGTAWHWDLVKAIYGLDG